MSDILHFDLSGHEPTPRLADTVLELGYDKPEDPKVSMSLPNAQPKKKPNNTFPYLLAMAAVPEESADGSDELKRGSRTDTGNLTDSTAKFMLLNQ